MSTLAAQRPPAIRLRGVRKSFGMVEALKPVTLDVEAGKIHALVGQNGAGKSTTLGILAGRIAASGGDIEIGGSRVELGDPRRARAAGVVAIYQELTIVPALSAVANVFLGQTYARRGLLAEAAMRRRFHELTARLGVTISAEAEARSLSVADQQTLEILRALEANARIILFDEPTTALAPPEREALFKVMRDLRAAGHTLIYVSHNLDEVLDISDAISVFRNGRLIETRPRPDWTKSRSLPRCWARTWATSIIAAPPPGRSAARPPSAFSAVLCRARSKASGSASGQGKCWVSAVSLARGAVVC